MLGLIDNHKRIHGDNPSARGLLPEAHRSRGGLYPPEDRGSWKRKYSLRNKNPQASFAHPFVATTTTSLGLPASTSRAGGDESVKTPPLFPGSSRQSPSNVTGGTANTNSTMRHKIHHSMISRTHQAPKSRRVVPAEENTLPTVGKTNASLSLPSLLRGTASQRTDPLASSAGLPNATITAPAAAAAVVKLAKQPSINAPAHSSANSKFVWVKTQKVEGAEVQNSSSVPTPAGQTENNFSSSASAAESTVAYSVCKKTSGKKPPQRPTQDTRSSKYKWVSSTASQAKVSRKSLLPKDLPTPQKALEKGGIPKRVKAAMASPATTKREVATSSRSSRYSWKAAAAGGPAARQRSSFYWTPDKRNKGVRGAFSPGSLRTSLSSHSSSPGAFKLRSRMKIVRRSVIVILQKPMQLRATKTKCFIVEIFSQNYSEALKASSTATTRGQHPPFLLCCDKITCGTFHLSFFPFPLFCSCSGSEKVSSTSGVKLFTPGRSSATIRAPAGARRAASRELVSFGRHKLRRLCTSFARTSKQCKLTFHISDCNNSIKKSQIM